MLNDIIDYVPQDEREASDKRLLLTYGDLKPLLYREYPVAHFTSSGFIMNKTLDKVLFVYHNIYDAWCWSGGHNDGDEDFMTVALREAQEETALLNLKPLTNAIVSFDILPVFGHYKKSKYVSGHLHINTAYVLIGDEFGTIKIKADENSGVKWFDVAIIDQIAEKELLPIYQKIIERARRYQNEII